MKHSIQVEKYDKLVEILIDTDYKMIYYNPDKWVIVMEVFNESELAELIMATRNILVEDFYSTIKHVCDSSYLVFIYLKDETV